MGSVPAFAAPWQQAEGGKGIDLSFPNAGISSPPPGKDMTDEVLQIIYATSFLGSFVPTNLLEKNLAPKSCVLFASSGQYAGDITSLLTAFLGGLPQPNALQRLLGQKTPDSQHYANTMQVQVAFAHLLQKR